MYSSVALLKDENIHMQPSVQGKEESGTSFKSVHGRRLPSINQLGACRLHRRTSRCSPSLTAVYLTFTEEKYRCLAFCLLGSTAERCWFDVWPPRSIWGKRGITVSSGTVKVMGGLILHVLETPMTTRLWNSTFVFNSSKYIGGLMYWQEYLDKPGYSEFVFWNHTSLSTSCSKLTCH